MGWFLNKLQTDHKELERDFSQLSLKVVSEFVHKDQMRDLREDLREDMSRMEDRISAQVDRIVEKLDAKADKD